VCGGGLDRAVLGCEDCVRQRINRLQNFEVICYVVGISGVRTRARNPKQSGNPFRVAEIVPSLLSDIEGPNLRHLEQLDTLSNAVPCAVCWILKYLEIFLNHSPMTMLLNERRQLMEISSLADPGCHLIDRIPIRT
jgi:hypothetical protein